MTDRRLRLLAALACLSPLPALATPFTTFNQAALSQGFALPVVGETTVLEAGASRSLWTLDLSSEYHEDQAGTESLTLDGETTRLAWRYTQGAGGWEWGFELPVVHVGGGFMDSFIEGWHDFFGLPNGGREFAPRDRYQYRYERDGAVVLDRSEEGWALGDVRLSAGWAVSETMVLRGELKLPTGDEDKLTGGVLGGAVWADWALPRTNGWSGFLSLGLSANDNSDVLEDQQKTLIPFGGIGMSYRLFEPLEVGVQYVMHGALYDDTEIDALKKPGGQLVFGGRWLGAGWGLDLAVQEDIITHSSPDFSIHVGLRLQPE
jgi:hypothetical protein